MSQIDSGDTAFMLISAALVLFMTPGLAFFYGGLVRSKNVVNTMMMSLVAMGIVTVQWILWGYSIAFSPNDGGGATMGIRSRDEHEHEGLDFVEHGEKGYHEIA